MSVTDSVRLGATGERIDEAAGRNRTTSELFDQFLSERSSDTACCESGSKERRSGKTLQVWSPRSIVRWH